jgi:hypothetical protein
VVREACHSSCRLKVPLNSAVRRAAQNGPSLFPIPYSLFPVPYTSLIPFRRLTPDPRHLTSDI